MQNQKCKSASSYQVSLHLNMVGAHLLRSRPTISILEHLLQDLHQLVSFNIVARLPGRILNSTVLPSGCTCFSSGVTQKANQLNFHIALCNCCSSMHTLGHVGGKNRSRQWNKLKSRTSLTFFLSKASPDASHQYTLTFMFQSIFTIQFDCALSL
jgi:hypothetical protein